MVNARIVAVAGASALLMGSPVLADPIADFYKGKVINVYSGHSKGGAYSAYARLVGRHLGKHIPGNPTAVFRLKPGASGLVLAHWLHDAASKDGLHIGTFHERIPIEPMIAPKGIKFDGRDFTWLAALAKNASVCFTWAATGIKTLKDLQEKDIVAGASGTTASDAVMARLMNKTLGTRFKIIAGYRGADILLALERGEVQARCGFGYPSLKTTRPDWLTQGKINIIAQLSSTPHPEIPNVPMLKDLVKAEDRAAVILAGATDAMARPYAAPPGIPKQRAAALINAFKAMVKDRDFLADAKKHRLEIDPIFGTELKQVLDELYKTPKSVAQQVMQFRTPGSNEKKIKRKTKTKKEDAKPN